MISPVGLQKPIYEFIAPRDATWVFSRTPSDATETVPQSPDFVESSEAVCRLKYGDL